MIQGRHLCPWAMVGQWLGKAIGNSRKMIWRVLLPFRVQILIIKLVQALRLPRIKKRKRTHFQYVCSELDHMCTYCSGKMGNDDSQTQEITRNLNGDVQWAVQNCQDLCPIIAHRENSGNTRNFPIPQSGLILLPCLLFCQCVKKFDPELSDGAAPAGAGRVLIGCRYGLR